MDVSYRNAEGFRGRVFTSTRKVTSYMNYPAR